MNPTIGDIIHRWAYEHYPVETLPRVDFTIIGDDNGAPKEIVLEGGLSVDVVNLSHAELKKLIQTTNLHRIRFSVASPTLFQDLEDLLFRIWGLRACKKPFRTHLDHYKVDVSGDEFDCCPGLLRGRKL